MDDAARELGQDCPGQVRSDGLVCGSELAAENVEIIICLALACSCGFVSRLLSVRSSFYLHHYFLRIDQVQQLCHSSPCQACLVPH